MPNRIQVAFINEALDNLEYLSEWENEFILSISELPSDVKLSERQNSKLNDIQQKLKSLGVT